MGCLAEGPLMTGCGSYMTLLFEFGLSGLFMGALALITGSLSMVFRSRLAPGFLITGAQKADSMRWPLVSIPFPHRFGQPASAGRWESSR